MTAHVVYSELDPDRPATLSPKVVAEIIRGEIGFDGLLMSDDVGMKALSGSEADKARDCLAAGVDLVLHCSGVLEEMEGAAKGLDTLSDAARIRSARALAGRTVSQSWDEAEAEARLGELVAWSREDIGSLGAPPHAGGGA